MSLRQGLQRTCVIMVMQRELFTQFIARISFEIPNATLAMFSTLKYVNAPNFEKFRNLWSAKYLGGFVVHSKAFDGRETTQNANIKQSIMEISAEVIDKNVLAVGEKSFYNLPNSKLLTSWIGRQNFNDQDALPLINAISPTTKILGVHRTKWADGAIGHMLSDSNDLQGAHQTGLFSSVHSIGHKGGFYVTAENLWQAAIIFTVRLVIKQTWLNDRDQFIQPNVPITEEFKNDCLIFMLFSGSNLTASAKNIEWNEKKWSIVNHFIPFTESEVNAPDRFVSDFMVQYLVNKEMSAEGQSVLNEGRVLWQLYFSIIDVRSTREKFKLNCPDVGWYQIRNSLKSRNASGDYKAIDFRPFETAYKKLSEKLKPKVYEELKKKKRQSLGWLL